MGVPGLEVLELPPPPQEDILIAMMALVISRIAMNDCPRHLFFHFHGALRQAQSRKAIPDNICSALLVLSLEEAASVVTTRVVLCVPLPFSVTGAAEQVAPVMTAGKAQLYMIVPEKPAIGVAVRVVLTLCPVVTLKATEVSAME